MSAQLQPVPSPAAADAATPEERPLHHDPLQEWPDPADAAELVEGAIAELQTREQLLVMVRELWAQNAHCRYCPDVIDAPEHALLLVGEFTRGTSPLVHVTCYGARIRARSAAVRRALRGEA